MTQQQDDEYAVVGSVAWWRGSWRGVALAAAILVVCMALTFLLTDLLPQTRLSLLYVAVSAAALLVGFPAAVAAAVLSVLFGELVVFDARGAAEPSVLVVSRDVVFLLVSSLLAYALDGMQRARQQALLGERRARQAAEQLREQADELHDQVAESEALTTELESVNQQLNDQTDTSQRAWERSERLQHFTALLLDRAGEAAVAHAIVEDGRRAVEAAAAAVARVGPDGGFELVAASGDDAGEPADAAESYAAYSPLADAIATGEPVWISNGVQLRERYPALAELAGWGHGAWAALPLKAEQRLLGGVAFSFTEPGEFRAEDRSFMLLLAQQCAQALDRARLYDLERRARVRAEFAERRLAFLADASERLSASLDYATSLASMAELVVPEFADWCLVHLTDEDGLPRLVAAVHEDGELLERRRRMEARHPPAPNAAAGIGRVLRTGEIEHIPQVDEALLHTLARDDEHFALMCSLNVRSQLVVPVVTEKNVCGTLTFGLGASPRAFDEADIKLAEELGRRAGQAVENARLYAAAHRASEAKSNFLAVMSHELRTPLNAIIGYSDLLLLGVPDGISDRALKQVERVRAAAGTLLHLVEEVLSFSRIEAGKEEVRISPVELNTLMRECISLVEPLAAEKNIALRLDTPDEAVKIISDERKIRQVITNLLSNAVKFTECGSIAAHVVRLPDAVLLSIEDTGIGIPSEHLERIFEPFWQVEPASTRRFGGTGLGLGVARKLARLLGGELDVLSEDGRGSRFTLRLPLRVPTPARTP